MKYITIAALLVFGLMNPNFGYAHGARMGCGMGIMQGHGMMGHGMTGHNMMDNVGCPMMMNMEITAEYLLASKDDLNLSKTQISKLETIQNNYQKDVVTLQADLNLAKLELHNILSKDEQNVMEINAATANIDKIENELRAKNIETYIAIKLILTKKQLEKMQDIEIFDLHRRNERKFDEYLHSCCGH